MLNNKVSYSTKVCSCHYGNLDKKCETVPKHTHNSHSLRYSEAVIAHYTGFPSMETPPSLFACEKTNAGANLVTKAPQ